MKKALAVLFAVIFAFSALAVGVSAETNTNTNIEIEGTNDGAEYVCEYCDAKFTSPALRDQHLASQNPVYGHKVACGNLIINDEGKVVECDKTFESRAALSDHRAGCGASNIDLSKAYFKNGDIINGIKYFVKAVIEFFESDTGKTIISVLGKIVDAVKGIDFSSVISTIKGIAEKIPVDTIVSTVEGAIAG